MGSTPSAPNGKLDLKDNALIVDHGGTSPFSDIKAFITSGYAGGDWDGNGIISSMADDTTYAVGYSENDNSASGVNYSTWAGQTVDSSAVLVKYTWYGDATLDGTVNLDDYNLMAGNFNSSGLGFSAGYGGTGGYTYEELLDNLLSGGGPLKQR